MTTTPEAARLADAAKALVAIGVREHDREWDDTHIQRAWDAIDALAALSQPDEARDAQRLDWLAANPRMELDHGAPDGGDEEDDCVWRVYKVGGSRNDREWRFMGQGATPRAALDAAMSKEQP